MPICRELGIGIVPYSPLGRGFLTGALTKPEDLGEADWRRSQPRFAADAMAKFLCCACCWCLLCSCCFCCFVVLCCLRCVLCCVVRAVLCVLRRAAFLLVPIFLVFVFHSSPALHTLRPQNHLNKQIHTLSERRDRRGAQGHGRRPGLHAGTARAGVGARAGCRRRAHPRHDQGLCLFLFVEFA